MRARLYFTDFVEALAEALLEALVGGPVVRAAGEIVGEARHVGNFFLEIVRVFVAFAVADIFHEAGDRVAKMERDGIGFGFVDVIDNSAIGSVDGIGLGREREIYGGLCEGQMAFGRAEEIERVLGSERDGESAGFGEADVLAGHAHHAAREIERIFAGFDHAREPVERGIGVGVAHGFVQRRDEIEVLLTGFVVAEEFALQDVFEELRSDHAHAGFVRTSAGGSELERVVSGARVTVGEGGDAKENVVRDFYRIVPEAVFFVSEGAAKKLDDLWRGEWIKEVDFGAGKQGADNFEGRILRGRADENDVAGFDVREKGILLGFVEAVDFVDENNGAIAGARFVFRGGHHFLDFLDAGENGAEGDEIGARQAGDEARERGFSAAGRAPKKHGADVVTFDLKTKRLAGTEQFFLADEFVERAGTHTLGERLIGGGHVGVR